MKFAVLQFPGSNCDQDCVHVLRNVFGRPTELLWHKEHSVGEADAVFIPGGFSYGDYLRTGSIARFSPVMSAVKEFADNGGYVFGICNGFQILCEAGMLPGALIRNRSLQFRCEHVYLQIASHDSPFTAHIPEGKNLCIPIAHGEGNYFCDDDLLEKLEANNQILFQYVDAEVDLTDHANPNGSRANIAGICNEKRNVAGMMPHPERASEPALGEDDGRHIFHSLITALKTQPALATA